MSRAAIKKIPLRPNRFAGLGARLHRVILILFLVQFALVWLNLWTPFPGFGKARWPDGLLLVLAAAVTVSLVSQRLPGQNVMLAGSIILVIAAAVHTVGALSAIPFGPYMYLPAMGQVLFYPLPWAVPILWLTAVLTCRGVGRMILRPWRKTRNYGFWLLGLTALLVVLFDFALEPYATEVKHFWRWEPTKAVVYWYTTPWVNFLGWAVTALLILAFVTPSLINKKPTKEPPQRQPLLIWLLFQTLFATGAAAHQLWAAASVIVVLTFVITLFAWRGATW